MTKKKRERERKTQEKGKEKVRDQAGCCLEYLSSKYVPRPGTGAVSKDFSRTKNEDREGASGPTTAEQARRDFPGVVC